MTTTRDVTVSKLSQLQKRVLVFARQQMLAKRQTISPRDALTVWLDAPKWLNDLLTETLGKIFTVRKDQFGSLEDGGNDHRGLHPWVWFFEEMRYAERAIEQAAEKADCTERDVGLTRMYKYALPPIVRIGLSGTKLAVHPWPYYSGGWYFGVDINAMRHDEPADKAKVTSLLADLLGKDSLEGSGIHVDDSPTIPINCTIPEMLRDLFSFPLRERGYIHGRAFDLQAIGKSRYNNAQASLRRACTRLHDRRLIGTQRGQSHGLHWALYERSGIGLNEAGVAAADALLQTGVRAAQDNLGIATMPAAHL